MSDRTTAIILAGGTGERMGGDTPKQFMLLSGEPVISYSIRAFDSSPLVADLTIVCHPGHIEKMEGVVSGLGLSKRCRIVPGGKTRQGSSFKGIKECPKGTEYVLIHDAARPFVNEKIIENVLRAAKEIGAAMPVIDMEDTVIKAGTGEVKEMPDRRQLKRVQTPQGFRKDLILRAHEQAITKGKRSFTDDCSLVIYSGGKVALAEGSELNIKLTKGSDLILAGSILSSSHFRTTPKLRVLKRP